MFAEFSLLALIFLTWTPSAIIAGIPPTIKVSPEREYIFRRDDSLLLPCVATGNPAPQYYWKKNGIKLNQPGGGSIWALHGSLFIDHLDAGSEGYYQCFAKNPFGVAVSEVGVLREAYLDTELINLQVTQYVAEEDQPFVLPCINPESYPAATYSWVIADAVVSPNTSPVIADKRIRVDPQGNLHFASLIMGDSQQGKIYKCFIYNPFLDIGMRRSYSRLEVRRSSPAMAEPRPQYVSPAHLIGYEGESMTMTCMFSGNPEPVIYWSKVDGYLPYGQYRISSFNSKLELRNLKPSNAGEYQCSGHNIGGTATHRMHVEIRAKPRFDRMTDRPQDTVVNEGETVTINCNAYAKPEAQVVWMKNGQPFSEIQENPRYRFSGSGKQLTISDVCRDCPDGTSDTMVIQCNATNNDGYVFANGIVNVQESASLLDASNVQ